MTTDDMAPRIDIVIPTYNRAHLIETAVRAALDQSWWNRDVLVVDDASSDDTQRVLEPFFGHPRFTYLRLGRNLGTAGAKNAALLLSDGAGVTFHDSDDIPDRDKVLRQVRVLARRDVQAHYSLNWDMIGKRANTQLDVGAVLTHHDLLLPDGRKVRIARTLSMVDDLFPNLQMGSEVPGDWTHINSGLFRHDIFARLGGFEDCIEEDREFRNRLILNGEVIWVIPDALLTKVETPDSLTQSAASDYDSPQRCADRARVWDKVAQWRATGQVAPVPVDLADLEVDFCSAPERLRPRDMPMTDATRAARDAALRCCAPSLQAAQ